MIVTLALGWLASHWLVIAAVAVSLLAIWQPVLVWKCKAWILAAGIAWWGWSGHAAYDHLKASTDAAVAKAQQAVDAANLAASEEHRKAEQARTDAVAFADKVYQEGLKDGQAKAAGVLADYAAGRLVLRDKFRCAAQRPAGAPASSAGIGDGEAGAGLSGEDVQFLVRFAQESDAVVRQLTAAQAVIDADRAKLAP